MKTKKKGKLNRAWWRNNRADCQQWPKETVVLYLIALYVIFIHIYKVGDDNDDNNMCDVCYVGQYQYMNVHDCNNL